MTKEEYLAWKATRPANPAEWDHMDCIMADRCVKNETLLRLRTVMEEQKCQKPVVEYVVAMASACFGGAETDEFLRAIGAWPDWA
jgi:hypothetical protein